MIGVENWLVKMIKLPSVVILIICTFMCHLVQGVPKKLYLDSYITCNQLDYLVDEQQTYQITSERRPEVQSRVYMKCHMTFKAKTYMSKVCFTMMEFSPDGLSCNMVLRFYDGDNVKTGVGARFDCDSDYNYPYQWCSSGQFAMVVLERNQGRATSRDITALILVQQSHNAERTVYLDSNCDSLHLMDRSLVHLHNRHQNNSVAPPRRCEQTFEYIGSDIYPICVTMSLNKALLPDHSCPFLLKVGDGEPSTGAVILDKWTCDKVEPKEICSKGRILTVFIERLNYDTEQDPVDVFSLTVEDRSPAPAKPVSVTAIVLGVIGGIVLVVLLYFILATYLDNKKGIYIGPCCLCRKYCKGNSDDSMSTTTGFTSIATHDKDEVHFR